MLGCEHYCEPNRKNRCNTTECSLRNRKLSFVLLYGGKTILYLQIDWHFFRFGEYILVAGMRLIPMRGQPREFQMRTRIKRE